MSKTYYTTIGLEIHAELKTETKMFCNSKNDPDETRPNVNICPVCMAHPGTLPVINKKAVESVVKVGLAVGGTIADFTEFDRKNYFYPDIPKGYQISQYKYPIVSGGELAGVKITRIHLEEDTATSKHDKGDYSLVDYNRAGVPLMELVTEPVIHSTEEVGKFAKEFQLLLRYIGVSEANMEKGEMRVEVNISVSTDPDTLGIPVEVKNIGSFSSAMRAAEYETKRMTALLDEGKGDEIVKETRGWDDVKQKTVSQRKKEYSHDYRYFPDPDLPKLKLSEVFNLDDMRKSQPELPWDRRARLKAFGIKDEDVESYVVDTDLGAYFEKVIGDFKENKDSVVLASNYITSDLVGLTKSNPEAKMPEHKRFAKLITLVKESKLTSRAAKDILALMSVSGGDPEVIAEEKGMFQKNDEGAIKIIAEQIITLNPKVVADYKSGKSNALMSLVGQIMKESKGSANPAMTKTILEDLLK